MGKMVCSVLTACFIFMAALHLDAVVEKYPIYYKWKTLTWEAARLHCQKTNVDLITMRALNVMKSLQPKQPTSQLLPFWVGLVRHPEDARVWKEVSFKTGGLSEDNVTQSIRWDNRQMEPLCAYVSGDDQTWHSDKCSNTKHFHCSFIDKIEYFKTPQSWYNASRYCQNRSGQLVNRCQITASILKKTSWIGGYKTNYIWKWVGNFTPSITKWASNGTQSQDCAAYDVNSKKYLRTSCSERFHPLCLNDNLLVVKENKTWEEAVNYCLALNRCRRNLTHCRYKFNLLSLDEESDYDYIRDRIYTATTTEVWIGLRFLGGSWWWVDGQTVDPKWELPSCPSEGNRCGTLPNYGTRKWIIRDCAEKRNFICYKKINSISTSTSTSTSTSNDNNKTETVFPRCGQR